MCVFLDDGSYISADDKGIRRISTTSAKLWEVQGNYHHQINLTHDRQRILTISSTLFRDSKREDRFQVMSLEGKILAETKISDFFLRSHLGDLAIKIEKTVVGKKEVELEYSHFNSFHEIPPLQTKGKRPTWLAPGNLVLNGINHGFFVLSPDFSEILHREKLKNSLNHHVHDVQITKRGTLLYYNNVVIEKNKRITNILGGSQMEKRYSGIYEIDPVNQRIIRKFEASPEQMFYAWVCGGIQELDDSTWLFNHFLNGTYFYNHKKKKVINSIISVNADYFKNEITQQVNAYDLSKFLSHWK